MTNTDQKAKHFNDATWQVGLPPSHRMATAYWSWIDPNTSDIFEMYQLHNLLIKMVDNDPGLWINERIQTVVILVASWWMTSLLHGARVWFDSFLDKVLCKPSGDVFSFAPVFNL